MTRKFVKRSKFCTNAGWATAVQDDGFVASAMCNTRGVYDHTTMDTPVLVRPLTEVEHRRTILGTWMGVRRHFLHSKSVDWSQPLLKQLVRRHRLTQASLVHRPRSLTTPENKRMPLTVAPPPGTTSVSRPSRQCILRVTRPHPLSGSNVRL